MENLWTELVCESGIEGEALEHLVRLAVITGLPDKVSAELQQPKDIEDLSEILLRVLVKIKIKEVRDFMNEVVRILQVSLIIKNAQKQA